MNLALDFDVEKCGFHLKEYFVIHENKYAWTRILSNFGTCTRYLYLVLVPGTGTGTGNEYQYLLSGSCLFESTSVCYGESVGAEHSNFCGLVQNNALQVPYFMPISVLRVQGYFSRNTTSTRTW